MAETYVSVYVRSSQISRETDKIFFCGVRSPVQVGHELPKNPINLITTLVVITKEPFSVLRHVKGSVPEVSRFGMYKLK